MKHDVCTSKLQQEGPIGRWNPPFPPGILALVPHYPRAITVEEGLLQAGATTAMHAAPSGHSAAPHAPRTETHIDRPIRIRRRLRLEVAPSVRTHMNHKLSMALWMIVGSFFVYCGQNQMGDGGDDTHGDGGFVTDADAEGTCCASTVPSFTKLTEGDLLQNGGPAVTAAIAVGTYREVVVYITADPSCSNFSSNRVFTQFRPDATSPFGSTGQTMSFFERSGGRIRVDGPDMMLSTSCPVHYMVAGVE